MITCRRADAYARRVLDGEPLEPGAWDHIEQCQRCRPAVERARRFRSAMDDAARRIVGEAALDPRVFDTLAGSRSRPRLGQRLTPALLAAVGIVFAVVVVLPRWPLAGTAGTSLRSVGSILSDLIGQGYACSAARSTRPAATSIPGYVCLRDELNGGANSSVTVRATRDGAFASLSAFAPGIQTAPVRALAKSMLEGAATLPFSSSSDSRAARDFVDQAFASSDDTVDRSGMLGGLQARLTVSPGAGYALELALPGAP